MNWTFTLILCLFIGQGLFAQELIPEAARAPITNPQGDPITNILDPDGMMQGDWYYDDITEAELVYKQYQDNNCTQTSYFYQGAWVNASEFEQSAATLASLRVDVNALLLSNQINLNLNSNQQVALLFDDQGTLQRVALLGEWNASAAAQLQADIQNLFSNTNLSNVQDETFLLL